MIDGVDSLQGMLDALLTFGLERIQPRTLLFLARRVFGATVAAEAEKIALNDNINVLRKSFNEFPTFGE